MATEEYSIGYDEGYQEGWNAAMDATPQPCPTCESLARAVMMDQTAHDTHTAARRQWTDIDIDKLSILAGIDPTHKVELGLVRSVVRTILRGEE
jgi:hypothetical protein